MSKYKDADLILKLYDLRREKTMREARNWFFQFNPKGREDFIDVLTSDKSGLYRMVVSYWDMAASFAVRGPLSAELLLESAGELIGVWALIEPFIAELRALLQLPEFLRNLEQIISRVEWAPARLEWIKARIAAQRAAEPPSK